MLGKKPGGNQGSRRKTMPTSTPVHSPAMLAAADHRKGTVLIVMAMFVWSSGGLLARLVEAEGWTVIFWRTLFAAATLFLYILIRDRRETLTLFRRMGWPGVIMATSFCTASTCFVLALSYTTVANILIIQSTSPFIAALLAFLLMGERVPARRWFAIAAALAGIVIMVWQSGARGTAVGDLLSVGAALGFSVATVLLRRQRKVRMTPAACLAAVLGCVIAAFASPTIAVSAPDLGFLALFGSGQLALGLILYTSGARQVPAAEAALLSVLEAILAPLWVWLVVNENPGPYAIIGGGVVLLALIANTVVDARHARIAPPAL
jgi:drug/metabolite transporter (DMT)-like permease